MTRRRLVVWACTAATLVLVVVIVTVVGRRADHVATGPSTTSSTTSTATVGPSSSATTSTTTTTPSTGSTTTTTGASTSSTTTTTPAGGPAVVIRRGGPGRAVVALTFDAGSDVGFAADILDTLAANGIKATFGMTGSWANAHPELVARMAREGHQLVNHSYDHPSFTGRSTGTAPLTREQRLDQLARADAAIQAATGHTSAPWFRPPYGDEDASVRADVASAGYFYEVMWTVDSLGWRGISTDAIVDRCLGGAENGAIYLFHVGSASADAAALQPIIDGLRAAGYGFARVADIV